MIEIDSDTPSVICGCCEAKIPDLQGFNVYYGIEPYPTAPGFGICPECLEMAEMIVSRASQKNK